MKIPLQYFRHFHNKNRRLGITFLKNILIASFIITILLGCSTTVYNIKSSKELSGNKLLTGRLVFFQNDVPVENSENFTVYFKEKMDKKLRVFKPDENGYVYIPLDQGQYYISLIEYRDFQGHLRIPVRQSSGIHIGTSDTVVNLGTVKVNLLQNESTRIAYLTTYAYPYAGKFIPSSQKPELKITQISEWDVIHQYISSKLNILPESIRNEVITFQEDTDSDSK